MKQNHSALRTIGWSALVLVLVFFVIPQTFADTYTEPVDGITWTFTVSNGEASVGTGLWGTAAISTSTAGAISIPSTLGGYPMTSIGSNAFYYCTNLTSVTIPHTVTNIGLDAFRECETLVRVAIPDSVTSIGGGAFYGCRKLASVALPAGVMDIGDHAFYYCSSLSSVMIPPGVTNIGYAAFMSCTSLASVTIPDSVTNIRDYAFCFCNSLVSLTIPDSVTRIKSCAFRWSGLATLYVPAAWLGTEMLAEAEVPSDCMVVYYDPDGSTTSTPVAVPQKWLAMKASGILADNGNDYEAAAKATAANGRDAVWACYLAGLDPADPDAAFTAEISFEDGKPVMQSVSPDLGTARTYTLQGKKDLMDEAWTDVTDLADPGAEGYRFFCAGVALPE